MWTEIFPWNNVGYLYLTRNTFLSLNILTVSWLGALSLRPIFCRHLEWKMLAFQILSARKVKSLQLSLAETRVVKHYVNCFDVVAVTRKTFNCSSMVMINTVSSLSFDFTPAWRLCGNGLLFSGSAWAVFASWGISCQPSSSSHWCTRGITLKNENIFVDYTHRLKVLNTNLFIINISDSVAEHTRFIEILF